MAICMEKKSTAVSIYLFKKKKNKLFVSRIMATQIELVGLGFDRMSWKMSSNRTYIEFSKDFQQRNNSIDLPRFRFINNRNWN